METALMMILTGSEVLYGPRYSGGGLVRAVEVEGAYEDSVSVYDDAVDEEMTVRAS